MKGMRKISRGSDFSGVMAYVFDGDLDDPRELKGELIGGNMSGRTPEELTEEFNLSKAIRPDIKRPVWHNSLRLPLNEKVDKETWDKIGNRYMEKMGFSENHQRCHMLHDDPDGQHIHIPASRIGLDGSIYLGKNENLRSTKIIAELEVEFGLKITKGPTYDDSGKVVMPEKSKVSKNEIEKALRTGTEPDRVQLQKLVDQALKYKPSATQFVERLQASGVDVIPNIATTGRLNGFTFNLVGSDAHFSGSKLGDNYKLSSLEKRGLIYDKDRESGWLIELKTRAGNAVGHDRAAKVVEGIQPGTAGRAIDAGAGEPNRSVNAAPGEPNRAIDPAGGRDSRELRGVDGPGAGNVERVPGTDVGERPGHRDSVGISEIGLESRDRESDPGTDQSGGSIGTDSGAKGESAGSSVERHDCLAGPDASGHHDGHPAALDAGVEVTDAGFIETGIKAIDDLQRASHKDRLKAERERIAASKKNWEAHGAHVKKTLDEWRRPHAAQLSRAAFMAHDSAAYRAAEIGQFAKATGAQRFEVTCSSSKPGQKSVKKVFTAEQLQSPAIIRSMATMSARRFNVSIRPDPASGVILLKGLDADGIKKLEAIGLTPAAVVDIAGKREAWIRTDATLSTEERTALTKRLETLTGVEQKHGGAGGLVGFSSAQKLVRLSDCPGQVAPAVGELIGEIRAEAVEAKKQAAQVKLESAGKAWEALFGEANPVPVQPAIKQPEPVPVPSEPKADFEAKAGEIDSTASVGGLETSTADIDKLLGLKRGKDGQLLKTKKSGGGDGTAGTEGTTYG